MTVAVLAVFLEKTESDNLCACGCGEEIIRNGYHNPTKQFNNKSDQLINNKSNCVGKIIDKLYQMIAIYLPYVIYFSF